jgi:hypothetical protein
MLASAAILLIAVSVVVSPAKSFGMTVASASPLTEIISAAETSSSASALSAASLSAVAWSIHTSISWPLAVIDEGATTIGSIAGAISDHEEQSSSMSDSRPSGTGTVGGNPLGEVSHYRLCLDLRNLVC